MVDVSGETYERNVVEPIVDSDGIFWLNENHIEGLDQKNLQVTTVKYPSGHRKHRYELGDELKKQPNIIFIHKQLANKAIMDCRAIAAH